MTNKNTSELNKFYKEILKFITENPSSKDAGKNPDFLAISSIFKIVESELKEAGLIEEKQWRFLFFKRKKLVLSEKGLSTRKSEIQEIRSNILEDGEIDIEVIVNALILEKLFWLTSYFSEFEQKKLKQKIEMVKKANPKISTKIINLVSYITTMDDNLIILLGAVS